MNFLVAMMYEPVSQTVTRLIRDTSTKFTKPEKLICRITLPVEENMRQLTVGLGGSVKIHQCYVLKWSRNLFIPTKLLIQTQQSVIRCLQTGEVALNCMSS